MQKALSSALASNVFLCSLPFLPTLQTLQTPLTTCTPAAWDAGSFWYYIFPSGHPSHPDAFQFLPHDFCAGSSLTLSSLLVSDVYRFLSRSVHLNSDFLKSQFSLTVFFISGSRSASTLKRYDGIWGRFRSWCKKAKVSFLPAKPMYVAMFLSSQLSYAVDNNLTYAPIKNASAAIYTAHAMASLPDVTSHSSVRSVRLCAQRLLPNSGNINRKDPLCLSLCISTVSSLLSPPLSSIFALQTATFIMVCFSGFLRYSCATHIFADEVRFYPSHMELFLEKRKNSQFRSGEVVCISRGSSYACPVSLLQKLLQSTGSSYLHVPVFRSFLCSRGQPVSIHPSKAWSYSQARHCALKALSSQAGIPLPVFSKMYGLHSLRSGGASLVARKNVPDHIFQAHGAWRSASSMHAYIAPSLHNKLLPTSAMQY